MGKRIENVEIKIDKMCFPNKGVGMYEDKKVFIANALPGQTVRCNVYKRKGSFRADRFEIIERADYEIDSDCPAFGSCGGCLYRTLPYEQELELKKNMVLELLSNAGVEGFIFEGIKPSPAENEYRNKMEFSFGDTGKGGSLCLGMRKRGSFYEVASAEDCKIVHEDIRKIVNAVREFFVDSKETFYHKTAHTGSLRHLLVRRAHFTGEILVALVTASDIKTELEPLKNRLLELETEGSITGILHIINDGVADIIKADSINLLYGRDYIYEKLLGLTFKISVFSFFQTNSAGAEVLYETVREFAGDEKNTVLFDLYCGTGTIAQLMSSQADKVVGIEIVEEAVEAARVNTKLNNIENCQFIAADVLNGVDDLMDKPDLIILDPPREGLHPKALPKICTLFSAPRMIYVSCKPTSLARDLPLLKEYGYEPIKIACVDLFPRTANVETVCLLKHTGTV